MAKERERSGLTFHIPPTAPNPGKAKVLSTKPLKQTDKEPTDGPVWLLELDSGRSSLICAGG